MSFESSSFLRFILWSSIIIGEYKASSLSKSVLTAYHNTHKGSKPVPIWVLPLPTSRWFSFLNGCSWDSIFLSLFGLILLAKRWMERPVTGRTRSAVGSAMSPAWTRSESKLCMSTTLNELIWLCKWSTNWPKWLSWRLKSPWQDTSHECRDGWFSPNFQPNCSALESP